jgi:ribosome biogenesis GTPase
LLATESGDVVAELSRFLYEAIQTRADSASLPAIGDWVQIKASPDGTRALIEKVLDRRTAVCRQRSGTRHRLNPVGLPQVLVANVDTMLIVTSLNQELNLRRLERYLTAISDHVSLGIILTKADLLDQETTRQTVTRVEQVAHGVPIAVVSSMREVGRVELEAQLTPRKTACLVGSSGVGKSTLINWLMGETVQGVAAVRESDDRGRHCTSSGRLLRLPGGALVIDTPGMRELQLWDAMRGLSRTFDEITELAEACRFRDCRHDAEPGCAIKLALKSGELSWERYQSYRKLQREAEHQARKHDLDARMAKKRRCR